MSNPYEAPKAPLEASLTRPGFRWRLIPSASLVLFGAYTALAPLILFVIDIVRSRGIPDELDSSRTLVGLLITSAAGGLWIVSGVMFWKRRWRIAVIFLLVGYGFGVFAGMLIWGS